VSLSALQYEPGDIVSMVGANADDVIVAVLRAMDGFHGSGDGGGDGGDGGGGGGFGGGDGEGGGGGGGGVGMSDSDLLARARARLTLPNAVWRAHVESVGLPLTNGVLLSVYEILRTGAARRPSPASRRPQPHSDPRCTPHGSAPACVRR
jgi:hypothetical protein